MTNWFQPEGNAIACVDLLVTGTATFTASVAVGPLTVNGALHVTGNTLLDGTLAVPSGDITQGGNISIGGNAIGTVGGPLFLQFYQPAGGVQIGDGTTRSSLTLAGDLTVTTGGIVNLGAFGVVGADFVTASAALVNVTGLTAATVVNGVYAFDANLSLASSDVNGLQLAVAHSGAGATIEAQIIENAGGAGVLLASRVTALATALPAAVVTAGDGVAKITGILRVGAIAGSITIQVLKRVAGNATVYGGSYLDVKRVQ